MTIEAQRYPHHQTLAHRLGLWWLEFLDSLEAANDQPRDNHGLDRSLSGFSWARTALGTAVFFAGGAALIAIAVFTRGWSPASGLLMLPVFGLLLVITATVALPRREPAGQPVPVRRDS